jgi:hypothetical protein
MSNAAETKTEEADECCASCGIVPLDDIQLERCDGGCDLVKYCSDRCQENHRDQHGEECKQRKKELHDKELFEQPDGSHLGECPLCFLPLSLGTNKSTFCSGCCKLVCLGCVYANFKSSGNNNCPFCREPALNCDEENEKRVMERVKVNDPAALQQIGAKCGKEGDYDKAVEYYTRAAKLGDVDAHYTLGVMYYKGKDIEKDEEKGVYHSEKAAIGGHPQARYTLAIIEEGNGNIERAVKHYIIAANLGLEKSVKELWEYYSDGHITKEELEATLRTHKAAIDATKSAQRDAAEVYHRQLAASR